jgi:hypothetical protein
MESFHTSSILLTCLSLGIKHGLLFPGDGKIITLVWWSNSSLLAQSAIFVCGIPAFFARILILAAGNCFESP